MVSFESSLEDERDGACKALRYQSKKFQRCDAATQRLGHDYCYNCWTDLSSRGMEKFPPLGTAGETRAAIAYSKIFFLKGPQMVAYRERPSQENGAPRDGILVKTASPPASWKKADSEHEESGKTFAVYAIRAADGSVYIGQTRREAAHRFAEHREGAGSMYLKERGILGEGPIWSVQVANRKLAMQLEEATKGIIERLGFRVSIGEPVD